MSSTNENTQMNSDLFKRTVTKAKVFQSIFFWAFRLATYFIILAAGFLFVKITYEGSITLFKTEAPFVNWKFLSERPQTLYVFEWSPDSFSEEQKEAVATLEAETREAMVERKAFYEQAIKEAEANEKTLRVELRAQMKKSKATRSKIAALTGQDERLQKDLEKADKKYRKLWASALEEVPVEQRSQLITPYKSDMEVPETETWKDVMAEDPEVKAAYDLVTDIKNQKLETNALIDAEKKRLDELVAERIRITDALPENLKAQSEKELGNLAASLAWPDPSFLENRAGKIAEIESKYDEKISDLTQKYDRKIEAATDNQRMLNKLYTLKADNLNRLENEKQAKILKVKTIEAGDRVYRDVYAPKVDAAGLSAKGYSYSGGGIFPAIAGTVLLTVGSMAIALTLGILSAVYLSEYAKPGTLLNTIRLSILNLAGVPSIVFGLFGFGMFVIFFDWNVSLLGGCFTLAFMVLPVIITASEESLRAIPQGFREGSLALGATKWTSIRTNVLPYALPGILTSSVLGVARVAGETAPIMFTAAYALRDNLPWEGLDKPTDFFFQGVMALPYHIYVVSSKIPQNEYTKRMQYGTAFVFLMIVAGIALTSILLRIRMRKKYKW
ncbi:phosphate ABC transporter permease PstA [Kiritimatiellaeota bacterium B1221]|nr:phosphate ABC transporter permease PstA [Kiritimatiellaeota bacterium B1221]